MITDLTKESKRKGTEILTVNLDMCLQFFSAWTTFLVVFLRTTVYMCKFQWSAMGLHIRTFYFKDNLDAK